MEHMTGFRCVRCGEGLPAAADRMTCRACGVEGILDVLYDYEAAAQTLTREALAGRERTMWRYRELLPVERLELRPPTAPGMTPVIAAPRLAERCGVRELLLKDDGRGPTASFKDRASAVGALKARELGRERIACASTGNAATSLAGAAAAIGLPATIFVPERAPQPKVAQLLIYGATVVRVLGSYDEAWRLCQEACERFGWYNRNCAVNPFLVEGKKTGGLEIGEQLGDAMPDWVAVSVGDGCTIAGIGKGLAEMARLGIASSRPRLLGVQAQGSRPIADAFTAGAREVTPGAADSLADSIAVSHPRNGIKALEAVRASDGAFVTVTDDEILTAMQVLARLGGVFGEPAAAAAPAGVRRAVADGIIPPDARVLCMVTGNGLKDIDAGIRAAGAAPLEVEPTLASLAAALESHPPSP